MKASETTRYIKFVLIHVLIGAGIFMVPFLSKIYAILIVLVGFRYVILRHNQFLIDYLQYSPRSAPSKEP